jgi:hypothetical protein
VCGDRSWSSSKVLTLDNAMDPMMARADEQ